MGTYLKKALFSLCFLAFLLFVVAPALAAETLANSQVSESTGILPSNPFYFMKEWGRSIRRTLSFTDLKKAEMQLSVVVEQIAEIEKLNELRVTKRDAFLRAIANYSTNIDLLKTYLQTIRQNRGSALVAHAVKQYAVLQGLLGKFENQEQAHVFDEAVYGAIQNLVEVTTLVPGLTRELRAVVDEAENDAHELHASLFVERLMRVASTESENELMKLQQALIQKWVGRSEFIELIGGVNDREALLQVIDIAREKVLNGDLKNALNVVRQALLDDMNARGMISRVFVARAMKDAKIAIDDSVKKTAVGGELAMQARGLIERARFQIAAAEAFAEDGSWGNAYGQVVGAITATRSAAVLLGMTSADYMLEFQYMKQYFDTVMERARAARLESKFTKNLFSKLGEAEVQIAKLGDLIAKNASVAKILSAIRNTESMFGTIDQLIKELAKHASSS